MKLAILGTNGDILRLAAAARQMGHEIAWIGDVRRADSETIRQLAPQSIDRKAEWELVLDRAFADAVLVGTGEAPADLRAEQLKRLAAEAMPLLVVHPVFESVLPYYEVDMTRRETYGIVQHYNPVVGHPIVAELQGWVDAGHPTLGQIHQVTCERRLGDNVRRSAVEHLARDVELLASVAGDIRRVTAIGPRSADDSFASLQVQMSSSGPASLRWSVRSSPQAATGLDLALIGERGSAVARIDDLRSEDGQMAWELQTRAEDQQDRRTLERFDLAGAAIERLAEAIAETDTERRAARSTWESATRAMEVVDAVDLSLAKGRTIDVYQQQLTERLAFRGTMAALGCGLLMVGFVAIVLVTMLGGAERQGRPPLVPGWPMVLLAVLAFFLVLQVVPLLAQKSKSSTSHAARRTKRDV
jgi:predicted dehydrogenase